MTDFAMKLAERFPNKPYLSASSIKHALGDFQRFILYMEGKLKFSSDALRFGSIHDKYILERDTFYDEYIVFDDTPIIESISEARPELKSVKTSKEYKEWKQEFDESVGSKTLVTPEEMKKVEWMTHRIESSDVYKHYLSGQQQVEFNDFIGDVPVRGFLDNLDNAAGAKFVSDLKTTQQLDKFKWKVRDYAYDIQAYIYLTVFDRTDFYWVAQSKFDSNPVGVFKASEQTLNAGRTKFETAVSIIEEYLDGKWKPAERYVTDTI